MSTAIIILAAVLGAVVVGGGGFAIFQNKKNKIKGNGNQQDVTNISNGNSDLILHELIKENTGALKSLHNWLKRESKRIDRLEELHKKDKR